MHAVRLILISVCSALLLGCASFSAPHIAQPHELNSPPPITGNNGNYMSPYTSDGVMAEWVNNATNASTGSSLGSLAGGEAGRRMASNIPFFGQMIGESVGSSVGRSAALSMAGGQDFIRDSSDLSFNNLDDMAVWLYVHHSEHPHYQDALGAAFAIYPDLQDRYQPALIRASAHTAN